MNPATCIRVLGSRCAATCAHPHKTQHESLLVCSFSLPLSSSPQDPGRHAGLHHGPQHDAHTRVHLPRRRHARRRPGAVHSSPRFLREREMSLDQAPTPHRPRGPLAASTGSGVVPFLLGGFLCAAGSHAPQLCPRPSLLPPPRLRRPSRRATSPGWTPATCATTGASWPSWRAACPTASSCSSCHTPTWITSSAGARTFTSPRRLVVFADQRRSLLASSCSKLAPRAARARSALLFLPVTSPFGGTTRAPGYCPSRLP